MRCVSTLSDRDESETKCEMEVEENEPPSEYRKENSREDKVLKNLNLKSIRWVGQCRTPRGRQAVMTSHER